MKRYLLPALCLMLTAAMFTAPAHSQPDPRETLRDVLIAAYGAGDTARVRNTFAEDYVRQPGDTTRDEWEASVLALRAALPDLQIEIERLIADGSRLAARYHLYGTFQNELIFPNTVPIPPTGQPFTLTVHSVYVLNDAGQIAQEWNGFDNLSFLVLIGALPAPAAASDAPPPPLPMSSAADVEPQRFAVRRVFDAYNTGDLSAVQDAFAPDYVAVNSFGTMNYAALTEDIARLRESMPNLLVVLDQTVAEGNWVAAQSTLNGTFLYPYTLPDGTTIPATAGIIKLPIVTFFGFNANGQIAQSWELYDSWDFLSQLGLALPTLPDN